MFARDLKVSYPYVLFRDTDCRLADDIVIFLDATQLYSPARAHDRKGQFEPSDEKRPANGRGSIRKAGYAIVRIYRTSDEELIARCQALTIRDFLANKGNPSRYESGYSFELLLSLRMLTGETTAEFEERQAAYHAARDAAEARAEAQAEERRVIAADLNAELDRFGIRRRFTAEYTRVTLSMDADDALQLLAALRRTP